VHGIAVGANAPGVVGEVTDSPGSPVTRMSLWNCALAIKVRTTKTADKSNVLFI